MANRLPACSPLTSAPHEYEKKGRYKIAVKVIDIFGNDTTKVVEVKI